MSTSSNLSVQTNKQSKFELPKIVNGRMVFKSNEEFYAFVDLMDQGDFTNYKSFEKSDKFASLFQLIQRSTANENLTPDLAKYEEFGLPHSFQRVLNEKGEVVIGSTIIWYANGKKHFVENLDESKLALVKISPEDNIVKSTPVGNNIMPVKGKSQINQRTFVGLNSGPFAYHQREFWQTSPSSGHRKYVHEIQSYTDAYWGGGIYYWNSRLILRIKLEWRGCCNWKPAGETREIGINITCNNLFYGPPFGYNISPTASFNENIVQSGDVQRMIGQTLGSGTFGSGNGWDAELSGTIYHRVVGDSPSNAWTNAGYPLW